MDLSNRQRQKQKCLNSAFFGYHDVFEVKKDVLGGVIRPSQRLFVLR